MKEFILTIIVPFYNSEQYISKCAESILKKINSAIEVIFVNDGSKDNSVEILRSIINKYNREAYIIQQENSGVSSARNLGIKYARGKYIVFVDSDDCIEMETEKLIESLHKNNVDLLLYNAKYIDSTDNKLNKVYSLENLTRINELFNVVLKQTINAPWGKVFKKEIIIKYNIRFKENIYIGEDYIFLLDYINQIESFDFCKDILYLYRINLDSVSLNLKIDIFFQERELMRETIKFVEKNNLYEYIECVYSKFLHKICRYIGYFCNKGYSRKEIFNYVNEFCADFIKKYKYKTNEDKFRKFLVLNRNYFLFRIIYYFGEIKTNESKKRTND